MKVNPKNYDFLYPPKNSVNKRISTFVLNPFAMLKYFVMTREKSTLKTHETI